eukprot:COSAG06_NODE_15836_length_1041_cov_1.082803_1_plen_166_part_00
MVKLIWKNRSASLYQDRLGTNIGKALKTDACSRSLWSEALAKADVTRRRAEVDAFNQSNRWTKRGLALLPTMYGVNFPVNMLNQVCALVMVYTDGTVLVSHGGVEMGQGLNTKMAQVRNTSVLVHFYTNKRRFATTGSGRTEGKLKKRDRFLAALSRCGRHLVGV